jgi:hypothetical protein
MPSNCTKITIINLLLIIIIIIIIGAGLYVVESL